MYLELTDPRPLGQAGGAAPVRPLDEVVLTIPGASPNLDDRLTVGELETIRSAEHLEDVLPDEGSFREFLFPSMSEAKRLAVTLVFCLTHEPVDGPTALEYFEKLAKIVKSTDRDKFGYPHTMDRSFEIALQLGGAALTLEVAPRGAAYDATPRLREVAELTSDKQASLMLAGNLAEDDAFVQASNWQKDVVLKLMTPSTYTVLAEALGLTTRRADPLAEIMGPTLHKMFTDVMLLKNPFTSALSEIDRELDQQRNQELNQEESKEESKEAEPRTGGRVGLPSQSGRAKSVPALTIRRHEKGVLRVDGTFQGRYGVIKASFVISLDHLHCIHLWKPTVPM